MKHIEVTGDERTLTFCAYCGAPPVTRDHVPPKALLDKPYPDNLPVVGACASCNAGFSADDQYLACLLECTIHGSVAPEQLSREQVRRTLASRPAIRARLAAAQVRTDERSAFRAEVDRVNRMIQRLGQGHAMYELHCIQHEPPLYVVFAPFCLMTSEERASFETPPEPSLLPEVGSRGLTRVVDEGFGWVEVQAGRYRYLAWCGPGVHVRMAISEYLACEVCWQ